LDADKFLIIFQAQLCIVDSENLAMVFRITIPLKGGYRNTKMLAADLCGNFFSSATTASDKRDPYL
jgi:hypothetical protein